jgi:hypothetical protein
MQLFRGKWLNENAGADDASRVTSNVVSATDEDVVLIPEYVDTPHALTKVEVAFERNYGTVITAMIP